MKIETYKDLIVWQKSIDLVTLVYKFTERFPSGEAFGLVSQMRRAAVSIPSNIAEGRRINSRKDFQRFLSIAFGSVSELETQVIISEKLNFGSKENRTDIINAIEEISKMLYSLMKKLSS